MKASLLAKVDPLNNELAYVGVVGLSLVLSVFGGMSLIWPGDELTAQSHYAPPGASSKADATVGPEQGAHSSAPGSHKPQSQHEAFPYLSLISGSNQQHQPGWIRAGLGVQEYGVEHGI